MFLEVLTKNCGKYGKCGELSVKGVFQNGLQNKLVDVQWLKVFTN